jgi:two-component system, cell cycle response regulator
VFFTVLWALAVAYFAEPHMLVRAEALSFFYLRHPMLGLLGLALLFNVYMVCQQLQIHRVERHLRYQISLLDKMGVRTEEVYQLAVLDPLTGLYNRRFGEQRLAEEILRAERQNRPLTILLLDMDRLKHVNDTFGHSAGDQLIQSFAERLQRAVRGTDLVVRLGGDEFLVLLPDCTPGEVERVLERLGGASVALGGHVVPLSFSAGWSDHVHGEMPEQLLERADAVLYTNKRAGKEKSAVKATTN